MGPLETMDRETQETKFARSPYQGTDQLREWW